MAKAQTSDDGTLSTEQLANWKRATQGLIKSNQAGRKARVALQTQLEAWQTTFGTAQLTHAAAERDALAERIEALETLLRRKQGTHCLGCKHGRFSIRRGHVQCEIKPEGWVGDEFCLEWEPEAALDQKGEPELEPEKEPKPPRRDSVLCRCRVCGWPLTDSTEKGCTRDSCSMRPPPRDRQKGT